MEQFLIPTQIKASKATMYLEALLMISVPVMNKPNHFTESYQTETV